MIVLFLANNQIVYKWSLWEVDINFFGY